MVKVELPRAQWDFLLMLLSENYHGYVVVPLITEIENQVYSQEY